MPIEWGEDGLAGRLGRQAAPVPRTVVVERQGPDSEGAPVRPDQRRGEPRRGREGYTSTSIPHRPTPVHGVPLQVSAGSQYPVSTQLVEANRRHRARQEASSSSSLDYRRLRSDRCFDVFVEYAKAFPTRAWLIEITRERIRGPNAGDAARAADACGSATCWAPEGQRPREACAHMRGRRHAARVTRARRTGDVLPQMGRRECALSPRTRPTPQRPGHGRSLTAYVKDGSTSSGAILNEAKLRRVQSTRVLDGRPRPEPLRLFAHGGPAPRTVASVFPVGDWQRCGGCHGPAESATGMLGGDVRRGVRPGSRCREADGLISAGRASPPVESARTARERSSRQSARPGCSGVGARPTTATPRRWRAALRHRSVSGTAAAAAPCLAALATIPRRSPLARRRRPLRCRTFSGDNGARLGASHPTGWTRDSSPR